MSRAKFADVLRASGLLTLAPGAKHDGQHVFHIVASANGGPDHTDNFLYALGGSFNISIGDRLDPFNCVLAGRPKARRAVAIALCVACDESLHRHIDKRGKALPTLFTGGHHRSLCERFPNDSLALADALYNNGNAILRDVRAAERSREHDEVLA
ncbi:hypothetical protein T492DRAFT_410829 [Pavlovales sp. CCMP2436]|nr:hypothetical protein T492DRAFT_410829 [Pavlovales sp. CCMP2436]